AAKSCATRRPSSGDEGCSVLANGMAALARTPVFPAAITVGPFPAQLRRPRPRSATAAIRRLRPFDAWGRILRAQCCRAGSFRYGGRNHLGIGGRHHSVTRGGII